MFEIRLVFCQTLILSELHKWCFHLSTNQWYGLSFLFLYNSIIPPLFGELFRSPIFLKRLEGSGLSIGPITHKTRVSSLESLYILQSFINSRQLDQLGSSELPQEELIPTFQRIFSLVFHSIKVDEMVNLNRWDQFFELKSLQISVASLLHLKIKIMHKPYVNLHFRAWKIQWKLWTTYKLPSRMIYLRTF